MKSGSNIFLLLALITIVFSMSDCKKEDTEKMRREAYTSQLLKDINADSLRTDVEWLQNLGTRFALADNHRKIAVRIKNRFIRMGYADAVIDSFFVIKTYKNINYEQWQYNVIATIEGTEDADSLCVVGGHYDDVLSSGDPFQEGRGANDNASGTAAVLEIARIMKKNNYPPETTIKFIAFGAEEIGLWGSRDFAANPDGFAGAVRFMLNFDMVAYATSGAAADWFVNLIDYDNSHLLRTDAERLCTAHTSLKYINDNTNYNRSDSYPFFANGYKALFFVAKEIDPGYHTLNDISLNCNYDYCREIVKLACALLVDKN